MVEWPRGPQPRPRQTWGLGKTVIWELHPLGTSGSPCRAPTGHQVGAKHCGRTREQVADLRNDPGHWGEGRRSNAEQDKTLEPLCSAVPAAGSPAPLQTSKAGPRVVSQQGTTQRRKDPGKEVQIKEADAGFQCWFPRCVTLSWSVTSLFLVCERRNKNSSTADSFAGLECCL